ncbi:MAG TPA: RidA family protein [Gemmatimonadaceae bacterium]|nr:RidA family protein [Gemmatimonadaceae bacterium]
MSLSHVATRQAPEAIGPYSQAIKAGGFLFTAGQIALDPANGKIVEGGVVEQTERVMKNLTAVLAEAGADWGKVVKTTVFLTDLADFPVFNDVYGRYLGSARPARSTVQVSALPRNAAVEIELVARLED